MIFFHETLSAFPTGNWFYSHHFFSTSPFTVFCGMTIYCGVIEQQEYIELTNHNNCYITVMAVHKSNLLS